MVIQNILIRLRIAFGLASFDSCNSVLDKGWTVLVAIICEHLVAFSCVNKLVSQQSHSHLLFLKIQWKQSVPTTYGKWGYWRLLSHDHGLDFKWTMQWWWMDAGHEDWRQSGKAEDEWMNEWMNGLIDNERIIHTKYYIPQFTLVSVSSYFTNLPLLPQMGTGKICESPSRVTK